jgi:eukaryotic-like serine/threonine-protein kinase
VVHRDVKPANVLLGEGGRAKVADLGIATAAEATDITRSGTVLGTPAYMAPEQLEGAGAGPLTDVYALAAVAFEMLTGRTARGAGSPIEVAHRVATESAPDIRDAWADAPPALAHALRAGMAADPSDRPQSAGELVERIADAVAETPAVAPQGPGSPREPPAAPVPSRASPARSTRARLLAIAAVALIALGALAAVLASGDEQPTEDAVSADDQAESDEGASAAAAPAAPEDAVTSFYESAAAGDYDAAWALATPNFREQLGGLQAFEQQQSTLESIEFQQAEATEESANAARVDISTTATHSEYVENCTGSLSVVNDGGGWLIDEAEDISCTPA